MLRSHQHLTGAAPVPTPSKTAVVLHLSGVLVPECVTSVNELAPTLHNAFVQCFATNRRVRAAAFRQLQQLYSDQLEKRSFPIFREDGLATTPVFKMISA